VELFGKSPRVAITELFAENPEASFSVPEIIARTGVSRRGAYLHVSRLHEEGIIVKSYKDGKCWYYRVNENDLRGSLLGFIESSITLGRVEREIKRDLNLSPEEPLPTALPHGEAWQASVGLYALPTASTLEHLEIEDPTAATPIAVGGGQRAEGNLQVRPPSVHGQQSWSKAAG